MTTHLDHNHFIFVVAEPELNRAWELRQTTKHSWPFVSPYFTMAKCVKSFKPVIKIMAAN